QEGDIAAQARQPAGVERAQDVVADAAVLELLGEVPGPELARRGVGAGEEGLPGSEEELGRDEARALEALAVGEVPRERVLAQEALEVAPPLVLEALETRVVRAQRRVVARVQREVVRLLLVEELDVAQQRCVAQRVEPLAGELLHLDQVRLEVREHARRRVELVGPGGRRGDPARRSRREVERGSAGLHRGSAGEPGREAPQTPRPPVLTGEPGAFALHTQNSSAAPSAAPRGGRSPPTPWRAAAACARTPQTRRRRRG